MIRLEMTEQEVDFLCDALDRDLAELRKEIARTDGREFRRALKHREEVLTSVRMHLASPVEPIVL